MRIAAGLVLLFVIGMSIEAAAQQPSTATEQRDQDAAARVRALSERLNFREDDPADQARYFAELDELTNRLRGEVDDYIQTALSATDGSGAIQARIRALLADHVPNPEYGDLAFARSVDLRAGRSLVVVYTIVRPPHNDSATIRGYRASLDRFGLVATTGDDFDGYNMFKAELPSPLRGEVWLLAWGQAHTFNGTLVRLRVYAFDGESFRTVWSPEDLLNATPRLAGSGFAIDYHVRDPPNEIHDEYVLTPDGPVKTN